MNYFLIAIALIYGNCIALALVSILFSLARILQNKAEAGTTLRLIKGGK